MRSVAEWIGKNHDSPVPPRVRLRIFEKYNGCCYLSGRRIMPGDRWDLEHIISLAAGGEHRESNMAPALVDSHKVKTKEDMALKKKIMRVRKKHLGIHRSKRKIPGSKGSGFRKRMDGSIWKE